MKETTQQHMRDIMLVCNNKKQHVQQWRIWKQCQK